MARVVRKVSGKAVRGQKKGILYNKNFWIGISCGVVAIIALVLGLVFGLKGNSNTNSEPKVEDYFAMEYTYKDKNTSEERKVNFEKASYAEVAMHTNPNFESTFIDYVFVFATDLSKFYPKTLMQNETDLKDKNHESILEYLIFLQDSINLYDGDYKVKLYIVDTQDNQASDNMSIFSDSKFNGGKSELTTILSLVNGDRFIENFTTADDKEKGLFADSLSKSLIQSVVNNAKLFIDANFKDNK